jgi:hypothetical protein
MLDEYEIPKGQRYKISAPKAEANAIEKIHNGAACLFWSIAGVAALALGFTLIFK